MGTNITNKNAETGTTTAMRFLLPNEKFAIAHGNFASIYNEAKAYSKHIGLNMFDADSSYTFATDMVFYSSTKEIDGLNLTSIVTFLGFSLHSTTPLIINALPPPKKH